MAYLNRHTFEILQSGDTLAHDPDYFYADDMIAQTIQALNVRGYTARGANAGTPFTAVREVVLVRVRDSEGKTPTPHAVAAAYEQRVPGTRVLSARPRGKGSFRLLRAEPAARETRVTFAEKVEFRKLPPDTVLDGRDLIHFYDDSLEGLDFVKACADYNKTLLEWACALPLYLPM